MDVVGQEPLHYTYLEDGEPDIRVVNFHKRREVALNTIVEETDEPDTKRKKTRNEPTE